CARDRLYFDVW
nr:immunoglobulin heavy chain junction region [Mus musculus]